MPPINPRIEEPNIYKAMLVLFVLYQVKPSKDTVETGHLEHFSKHFQIQPMFAHVLLVFSLLIMSNVKVYVL